MQKPDNETLRSILQSMKDEEKARSLLSLGKEKLKEIFGDLPTTSEGKKQLVQDVLAERRAEAKEMLQGTKVFLSYAREDVEKVKTLYQNLKALGCEPWMDIYNIPGGADWAYEIAEAEDASEFALVCLSSTSVKRVGYVNTEMLQLLDIQKKQPEGGIFLIPVLLDKCKPPRRLNSFNWVDLSEANGFQRIVQAILAQKSRKLR